MDFIEFDPAKKHSFTLDGEPTRLQENDLIVLKELPQPRSRLKIWDWRKKPAAVFFIRRDFTIRIDDAIGIKFDVGKDKFAWLAAFAALVADLNVETVASQKGTLTFRFVRRGEKVPEGT